MSSSKGNTNRTRAQKYQNRTAFKNNLYDKSDQQKKLNSLHVSEVCTHCKGVIEWKIKYKKYKPLSQPKTCTKCSQKTVKKAYHVLCRECALNSKCCAKCLKSSEVVEIIPPEPTEIEQQKLKTEMDQLIKSLPERKRRSFLRYMAKGQKTENETESVEDENDIEGIEGTTNEKKKKDIARIPHSRETLLKKIEELKLTEEDYDDIDFSDDDDDDDSGDYGNGDDGDDEDDFSEDDDDNVSAEDNKKKSKKRIKKKNNWKRA